jgi:hypothetical protein
MIHVKTGRERAHEQKPSVEGSSGRACEPASGLSHLVQLASLPIMSADRPSPQTCIQRLPDDEAKRVVITMNTLYHLGVKPVMSSQEAINLSLQRLETGWVGQFNHVIYDFNEANVLNTLYQNLLDDNFTDSGSYYLVPIQDINFWVVNLNTRSAKQGGGIPHVRVDKSNMKAYHIDWP